MGGGEPLPDPSQPIDKIEAGINFVRVPRGSVEGSDVQPRHGPSFPLFLSPSPISRPLSLSALPRFRVGLLFWSVKGDGLGSERVE